MSQFFYNKTSLEEVVQWSQVIVEVKKAEPFTTNQVINIHPDIKSYPPYHKIIYHYKITGILLDERALLSKDHIIAVQDANEDYNFESHKQYYLEGYSESPIISTYYPEDDVSYDSDDRIILFLCYLEKDNRFRFTLDRSYEGLKLKNKILKIIAEKKNK